MLSLKYKGTGSEQQLSSIKIKPSLPTGIAGGVAGDCFMEGSGKVTKEAKVGLEEKKKQQI